MDSDSKPFQHLLQLLLAIIRCLISSMLNLIINNRLFSSSSPQQNDDVFYPTRATTFTVLMVKDALTSTTYGDIITTSSSSSSCAVCLNRMRKKDRVRMLRCSHVFHAKCIDRRIDYDLNVSCPLCRTPFVGPGYSGVGPAQPSWAVERLLYLFGDDLPICDPVMAHTL